MGYKEKIGIYTQIYEDKHQTESVRKYLILQVDFARSNATCGNFASWNCQFRKLKLWFHKLWNCLETNQLSVLQRFLSSSYFASNENFASWIPQLTKLLDGWFLLCFSSLHTRLVLAKGYEAPKLSFFRSLSFNLLCHELYKDLPHSWIVLVIKKLSKTPKLNTIWLETIERVLNMPIELKGNNYYSKVFKRVNYKL